MIIDVANRWANVYFGMLIRLTSLLDIAANINRRKWFLSTTPGCVQTNFPKLWVNAKTFITKAIFGLYWTLSSKLDVGINNRPLLSGQFASNAFTSEDFKPPSFGIPLPPQNAGPNYQYTCDQFTNFTKIPLYQYNFIRHFSVQNYHLTFGLPIASFAKLSTAVTAQNK